MARDDDWEECMCCGDQYLAAQINDLGWCTICTEARVSFNHDGIAAGRPCCRRYLSDLAKKGQKAPLE